MSKQNDDRSENNQRESASQQTLAPAESKAPESAIFWAPAKRFQLGNFQEERRDGGRIIQPEMPLQFEEHIRVTSNPAVIEFIKKSEAFRTGQITQCDSLEAAAALTAAHNARKGIRMEKSEDVSSTVVTEG